MSGSPDFRIKRSIPDLIASEIKPQILPETGWYRVSITENYEGSTKGGQYIGSTLAVFQNSWMNVTGAALANATEPPASWYLSEGGEVRWRGKITGGVAGTVVCVIPEEVRPQYAETWICATDTGGSANVTVWPDGSVVVDSFF